MDGIQERVNQPGLNPLDGIPACTVRVSGKGRAGSTTGPVNQYLPSHPPLQKVPSARLA